MATIRCRVEFHGYDGMPTLVPVPIHQVSTVVALKRHIRKLSLVKFGNDDARLWLSGYVLPEQAPLAGLVKDMDLIT